MWEEIARLAKDEGITVLLTTHYLEEADNLAANLAIVDRGTVVASGTPEQLKGELHGDAIHAELAESATRRRLPRRWCRWQACRKSRATAAVCAHESPTGQPRCRRCWRRWRRAG